jgi:hypothetical protein
MIQPALGGWGGPSFSSGRHAGLRLRLTEADMTNDTFPFQAMDAYLVAKEIAVLVHRAEIRHSELRDQASRAAISTFLQLSEVAPGKSGRRKR